jgi:hypothetical protein
MIDRRGSSRQTLLSREIRVPLVQLRQKLAHPLHARELDKQGGGDGGSRGRRDHALAGRAIDHERARERARPPLPLGYEGEHAPNLAMQPARNPPRALDLLGRERPHHIRATPQTLRTSALAPRVLTGPRGLHVTRRGRCTIVHLVHIHPD